MGSTDLSGPVSFGRYDLLERLATGGMGEVYLANMNGAAGFQKRVVIKKILPQLSRNPDFVRRFVDEGKLVVKLDHPNIVSVLDLGEVDGDYYLAMEYVDGDDLRAILRRLRGRGERLPVPLAVFVLQEICKGLAHAHQACDAEGQPLHIVHRDVSPSNVMVSRAGAVRVVDFGIAKAADRLSHSVTGSLKGKFLYMSPEQARGGALDQRSDIFSVGSVAYELLTGQRAFEGSTDLDTLERVKDATPQAPSEHVPGLPEPLVRLVDACLQRDPERRPASMEALLKGWQDYLFSLDRPVDHGELAAFTKDLIGTGRARPAERSLDDILNASLDRLQAGEAVHADSAIEMGTRAVEPSTPESQTPETGGGTSTQTVVAGNNRLLVIGLLVIIGVLLFFNIESLVERRAERGEGGELPFAGLSEAAPHPEAPLPAPRADDSGGDADEGVGDAAAPADPTPPAPRRVVLAGLPPEAEVLVDGRVVTPDAEGGVELPDGRASTIEVRAEGRASFSLEIPAESLPDEPVAVELAPLKKTVLVRSEPPGAMIEVDGRPVGEAPRRLSLSPGRSLRVEARLAGHASASATLRHGGPGAVTLTLAPLRTGRVSFRFFPANATVLLDGQEIPAGSGNRVDRELAAGRHTLVLRSMDGRVEKRQSFEVVPGKTIRLGTFTLTDPP